MSDTGRRGAPRGIAALYFLSGTTALAYEVLWARLLALDFGVSIYGVTATVTAFLVGLGAGCRLAARWADRLGLHQALLGFAAIEAGIATYALALPSLSSLAAPGIERLAQNLAWWPWIAVQVAGAVLLLALPAAAMGAGLPLVLRASGAGPQRVGRLYGINTLGAALGACLGLALLALMGWTNAVRAVAALGFAVAVGALALARSAATAPQARAAHTVSSAPASVLASPQGAPPAPGARAALLRYAAIGACSLLLEIGWTRLYGLVLLRTEYVLALILAIYLLGTALGSLLAASARVRSSILGVVLPFVAGAGALAGLALLPALSAFVQGRHAGSLAVALGTDALAMGACMLPTTLALGAWFPLLTRACGASGADEAQAAARLYSANCAGAALGAATATLVVIPLLGSAACVALAGFLLVAAGTLGRGAPRLAWAGVLAAALGAWTLRAMPTPAELMPGTPALAHELFRYEDAVSLTHVVEDANGQRTLLSDLQHMDASSDPQAVQIQADQARLPLLLRPHARSILFLGLGTGISASGSLAWPQLERTAVEISPGAVVAARHWFAPVNRGVAASLDIRADDVGHFLAADARRYDVIVGDLFHPDLPGMGKLLSVEQFGRVRARLAAQGVFVQWLALNQFDIASLDVVRRSFRRVFPEGQIYLDGMHLALVGAPAPLSAASAMAESLAALAPAQREEATGAEGGATWLGRYWGPVGGGRGAMQSETQPVIEFRLPRLRYLEPAPLPLVLEQLLRERPDEALALGQLGVAAAAREEFLDAYRANGLAVESWIAQMQARERLDAGLDDGGTLRHARELVRLAFESNPRDHWMAGALADDIFETARQADGRYRRDDLERVLRIDPRHLEALRALADLERARDPGAAAALESRVHALAPLEHPAERAIP